MSKAEADGLRKISVFYINKHGGFFGYWKTKLTWTSSFQGYQGSAMLEVSMRGEEKYILIDYTGLNLSLDETKKHECRVLLTSTICHYGGKRYWFLCPAWGCRRRVGTLYFGNTFACRHCYQLTYSSRNEKRKYRKFVSMPDIERQEAKVKRYYYRGKPTKKYNKYLQMQERFYVGIMRHS